MSNIKTLITVESFLLRMTLHSSSVKPLAVVPIEVSKSCWLSEVTLANTQLYVANREEHCIFLSHRTM